MTGSGAARTVSPPPKSAHDKAQLIKRYCHPQRDSRPGAGVYTYKSRIPKLNIYRTGTEGVTFTTPENGMDAEKQV